ncbi:MAG: hypothetical protein CBD31_03235 [Flavobacteriaceae bacterium TMED171]|nr:transcriptional regulator [Flavobacteriaceae bacterium]OUW31787.1 MAG: hypothetical protein CBD31_03235 [Flavobacteriaceae bacterium TMED171]
MLNSNEIVKRIEEVRNNYQLSAAAFATKIGVQRSAMSHILSGRNKPSLEFLMKIYEAFDEVELQWLILGNPSSFPIKENSEFFDSSEALFEKPNTPSKDYPILDELIHPKELSIETEETVTLKEIIYLYTDGRFERFFPKK